MALSENEVRAEHQRLDDLDAEIGDGGTDADDLLARGRSTREFTSCSTLAQTAASISMTLANMRAVGFRIGREAREFGVGGRHGGNALELADERGQRRVLHELVQRMRLLDDRAQRFAVAGLVQELMGDGQRAHDGFAFRLARQHDARRGGEVALDVPQQLGAIHAGHAHVGDDDVRGRLLHLLERLLAAECEGHVPALAFLSQGITQAIENGLFVVDK